METNSIKILTEEIKEYVSLQVELAQLKVTKNIAKLIGQLMFMLIFSLLLIIVFMFLSVAAWIQLGIFLQDRVLSAIIMTSFYFIAIIIIYWFRKQLIIKPISNIIIKILYEEISKKK